MIPLPRRSIRAISALLLITGLLAACADQAAPATPTAVQSSIPTLPPIPSQASTPVPTPAGATGSDSTALLTALNLPRLDGVTLRVLVWSGSYKNLFTAFGRVTGATMKITEITSTDEQLVYLGSSGPIAYDVLSIPIDSISPSIDGGRLAPVDLQQVPNYKDILPSLANLPLGQQNGQHYIVPTYWGYEGILYDPQTIPTPPTTWGAFWDPKYKGQIAIWDDIEFLQNTARLLGMGKSDPGAIYHLSDDQLAQVETKLKALRDQQPVFFEDPAELTTLMAAGKVKLAFGWLVNATDLQDQGHDIRMTYPAGEGTTIWYEALAVPSASPQKAAAFTLINTILDPSVQAWLSDRNYTVANSQAVRFYTPTQYAKAWQIFNLDLNNLGASTAHLDFQQPTERRDRYNEVWNRAKVGP